MLEIEFGQATDPGKFRTNNEDCAGCFMPKSRHEVRTRGWLFVLADGVGGLDRGEVASARTVQVITDGFAEAQDNTSLLSLLPRLIQHANAAVHDEGLTRERRGRLMASTVVACALRHDQAYVAHVGDSRCYHIHNGHAIQITQDHNLAAEQKRQGLISSAEAADSESRHVLSRALGPERYVTADSTTITLHSGDFLVLCCDGFYSAVNISQMVDILSQPKPMEDLAAELVRTAVENDGSDNTTVQVVAIRSVEPMAMYRGRLYPRHDTERQTHGSRPRDS
ncbi:MAG TPA: protein phosphatase 2C domain-containing protein [Terracidiphilus sp.]|jgi:protein phosphatase